VLVDRLTKRAETSGRADDNPETIRNRIQVFYDSTQPVLDTYWRLGKVAMINGLGEIEDIYENVKKAIVPNLIFLYGAPCTGKSTVAKSICQATGYKYLNLKAFYEQNKCINDNDKINKLMKYLAATTYRNFIVDSFLDTKAYAVVFFNHFAKPRSVIYF
jgi:adenylate kinase family enzyme